MKKVANNEIIIFEAKTLEEVYEKASASLKCSITSLDIELKQAPSKGIFGFFSKNAIITVTHKKQCTEIPTSPNTKNQKKNIKIETLSSRLNTLNKELNSHKIEVPKMAKQSEKENLFNKFYTSSEEEFHSAPVVKTHNKDLKEEISKEVNKLFSKLCYEIDEINVDIIDDDKTVYIKFSGADSALLIGKEGYRYKALSYVLFNWINEKYGMMLRLEIAEFLSNQEAAIFTYLEPVIETIKREGYSKTKILDGILIHIALTKLRDVFPDKYIAVKTTQKGEKYILVNEYRN
ncbi:MAG: spoIIIJ-associated protein [Arcobacteraceae bacterium]|jgi:spoIIIJ-associated protein